MKKLIKDCLTGLDNKTFDLFHIMIFIGYMVYFIIAVILVINGKLNLVDFGTGFGLLSTGTAAILKIREGGK